jgi:hypothetical protein
MFRVCIYEIKCDALCYTVVDFVAVVVVIMFVVLDIVAFTSNNNSSHD